MIDREPKISNGQSRARAHGIYANAVGIAFELDLAPLGHPDQIVQPFARIFVDQDRLTDDHGVRFQARG